MQLSELTVTLKGPIWRIRNFEIEGIDLLDKVEDDPSGDSSSVSVKNTPVSADNVLNVFINIGAPNNTHYDVQIAGKTDENPSRVLDFTQKDFVVTKNGKLVILIDKNIDDLIA